MDLRFAVTMRALVRPRPLITQIDTDNYDCSRVRGRTWLLSRRLVVRSHSAIMDYEQCLLFSNDLLLAE
jgi:hypothetical protein